MSRCIHLIANPAAGQDQPLLAIANRAFRPAGVQWEVRVTQEGGDAERFAREAAAAGADVVAVYGGDGTVMEVATALAGSEVPIAILPGGTANVIATELHIPADLAAACAIAADPRSTVRGVDMGQLADRNFLVRVGMGFEAQMVEGANRSLKDRFGPLAYAVSAVQALAQPQLARYRLLIDGQEFVSEGMTCIIANAGGFGSLPLSILPQIDVCDGLLDVVVITRADAGALLSVAATIVAGSRPAEPLAHWWAREVTVEADPPQTVQVDGEVCGTTPLTARVVHHALRVLVPPANQPPG